MTVIATVSVPADAIDLGAPMAVDPDVRVELDRVVPLGQSLVPFLWTPTADLQAVTAGLHQEPAVESVTVVERVDDQTLFRVEWTEAVNGMVECLAETDASVLAGVGETGSWRLQLRFRDPDSLSAFVQHCADRDVPVELVAIHGADHPEGSTLGHDITEAQREALEVALEAGYFEVPRRTDLVGLAERLGVSDAAVSERLRRGVATLLRGAIEQPEDRRS